ncbi:hypothetical protein C7S18_12150 [Ahniella affigens]|uniref:Uncharacterized protein n=1 Tax=Ahniella affigens TaxID=2021234 RepID=A0A2P1PST6_9GAMM|nr:hypothetical protein [Ahniella affigens]AVP97903.1 hypothetical protein C7S18_12150 [Ahniella affigens]
MSRQRRKADPVPQSGGSWILGADGKLVPNPEQENTKPNPGKTALAEAEAAKRSARRSDNDKPAAEASGADSNGKE